MTDLYTLYVGEECAGGCGNYCSGYSPQCGTSCCTWYDDDYYVNSLEFSCLDDNLTDLQFNFTLTNWGYETTPVWVSLCDDQGCVDVLYIELYPGEVYSDQVKNAVLDSAMYDLAQCFATYGNFCDMYYNIEVDLGQECVCSPVTLDYYINGLYLY